MPEIDESFIPIVIGVTGHRDLRDEDTQELKKKVGLIFEELNKNYPDTPHILLSALAEGADQLVAEVALEKGVHLFVVLPMVLEEYEKDFTTDRSRQNFYKLLNEAEKSFTLPERKTPDDARDDNRNQDSMYAYLGAFIVHYSQILIALWDGIETELTGGTSNVVSFKLHGVPEPYVIQNSLLDPVDSGPVYHIVTPRRSNPKPKDRVYDLIIKPDQQSKKDNDRFLEQINEFNRVSKENKSEITNQINKSENYLFPHDKLAQLPDSCQAIRRYHALADALAIHFQKCRQRTLNALFILAGLAIISFELYAHMFREEFMLLALYPIFLFAAYGLYRRVKDRRRDYQNKYLDYRALAEGMRVQFFWRLADLKDEVADHYMRKQRSELQWIRKAIRNWNMLAHIEEHNVKHSIQEQQKHNRYDMISEHWIADQYDFFNKRVKKYQKKIQEHKIYIEILFMAGVVIASAVVLFDIMNYLFEYFDLKSQLAITPVHFEEGLFRHLLIVCMGLLPAAAATLEGYDEKMVYSEQTKQYERMKEVYTGAKHLYKISFNEKKYSVINDLVLELGKEALSENGDWVLMYRERPLEVPLPKK